MLILKRKISEINRKIDRLLRKTDVKNMYEYVDMMNDTKKLIWRNFVIGISKGIGAAIGFTVLGAFAIYILRQVVMLNLPVIGAFVKDIMDIVEELEQVK